MHSSIVYSEEQRKMKIYKVNLGTCLQLLKHLVQLVKKTKPKPNKPLYFINPMEDFYFDSKCINGQMCRRSSCPLSMHKMCLEVVFVNII